MPTSSEDSFQPTSLSILEGGHPLIPAIDSAVVSRGSCRLRAHRVQYATSCGAQSNRAASGVSQLINPAD